MNPGLMLVQAALGASLLAGCDRTNESTGKVDAPYQTSPGAPPSLPVVLTPPIMNQAPPQSPPTAAERKDSAPLQGHMDPKEPAQRRVFENTKG